MEGLDTPEPIWRVPGDRMKMEREHIVPLTPAVVALLKGVHIYSPGDYVVAGDKPGKPISQTS